MINYLIFSISILFYFLIYYYIFKKLNRFTGIVSGVGFIIPFLILIFTFFHNLFILYFIIISLLSLIYWYDDYKGLGIFFRLSLQFIAGFVCFFLIIDPTNFDNYIYFFLFSLFFGFWNIFLVNTINFYDGDDLNVSVLIITIFSFFYFSGISSTDINKIIILVLIFITFFSLFNLFFNKYYFGDSGCFAIANIINLILITGFLSEEFNYNIALSPLILPIIDVIYVILKRKKMKESLVTRNFYHLYQRISLKINGFWYISPTIILPLIILFMNYSVMEKIFSNQLIILVFDLLIVILFYIIVLKTIKKFLN